MGKLSDEKKGKLAERVAGDVKDVIERHYKDLRQHEVTREDAQDVVFTGVADGAAKGAETIEKDAK